MALAEFGSAEEAVRVLRRAVELQPAVGHEKHMYLGQLLPGQDGISHLRRGVELLQAEFDARRVYQPVCPGALLTRCTAQARRWRHRPGSFQWLDKPCGGFARRLRVRRRQRCSATSTCRGRMPVSA